MPTRALLIMAKRPQAGQTKTRLSPPLTLEEAAALYECFLKDVLDTARAVTAVTPLIAYTPVEEAEYFRRLAPDLGLIPQRGGRLGERLAFVLRTAQEMGFEQVAAINSDSPNLPAAYLAQAFAELDKPEVDVALGPCEDGGYYLIGWKRPHPRLVLEVKMSTPRVFEETLALAGEERLRVAILETWYDVDDTADLERLWRDYGVGKHTTAFRWTHDPL